MPVSEPIRLRDGTLTSAVPVPKGARIMVDVCACNSDPALWGPDAAVWRPERWLEPGAERLKKYLVNFTKGSRVCLGKELARTEILYTLSLLARKWGERMELFETVREDVEIEHDFFNAFPRFGSKGVRVTLKAP